MPERTRRFVGMLGIPILIVLACGCLTRQASAVIVFSASDPAGDTFGSGTPVHDIKSITVDQDNTDDSLTFVIEFYGPISAPSGGAVDAIEGYIDIDIDNNPLSGDIVTPGSPSYATHLDQFGMGTPAPGLGVEFYLDVGTEGLFPNPIGFIDLVRTSDGNISSVPITFTSTSLSVKLFLSSDLGIVPDDSDIDLNVGAIFGPFGGGSATDQSPNNDAIPEPSTLALFSLGLGAAFGLSKFRRTRRIAPGA